MILHNPLFDANTNSHQSWCYGHIATALEGVCKVLCLAALDGAHLKPIMTVTTAITLHRNAKSQARVFALFLWVFPSVCSFFSVSPQFQTWIHQKVNSKTLNASTLETSLIPLTYTFIPLETHISLFSPIQFKIASRLIAVTRWQLFNGTLSMINT